MFQSYDAQCDDRQITLWPSWIDANESCVFIIYVIAYTLGHSQPVTHAFREFLRQLSIDFHVFFQIIFQQSPNIPENFVKLYSVFQKLDHLTCSKLN